LSSSQIFDSASQTLFQELWKPHRADYAIVDLGSGQAWLTSRLFIFSLILGEVSGLRAFVFRRALGRRYPWLEEAFAGALSAEYPVQPPESQGVSTFSNARSPFASEQWRVSNFVRQFVEKVQRKTDPPLDERSSYLDLGTTPGTWERAYWIDGERLERDLVGVLEYAWVDEAPDSPRRLVSEAVLRREASFVALVDSDRRFVGLVERCALLSQTSKPGNHVAAPDQAAGRGTADVSRAQSSRRTITD
jgi:hypothetical protein